MEVINDTFVWFAGQLRSLLEGLGIPPDTTTILLLAVGAVVLVTVLLLSAFLLIWAERKIVARIQDRLGPNRVGPFGVLQTVADLMKLVTKELITPDGADRLPYNLAPLLTVMAVVGIWAVVPLAPGVVGADINVGLLYFVAIGAVGTLGIMLAGLSSNNKYAMLGAFRTVAMLVSYAVPMVLALLVPVLLAGSMGMSSIVEAQGPMWFLFLAPLAALIFFVSSLAEIGRAPFDLLEADSEIVAGYNIEYSGLKFGMFFVAEFLHAFTIGALFATLFLGGWQGPGVDTYPVLGHIYFLGKTAIAYFLVIWIRGSFPRIRIDQVNSLNWKFFTPLALGVVIAAAIADKVAIEYGLNRFLVQGAANGLLLVITLVLLGAYARAARLSHEADKSTPVEAVQAPQAEG
jgi:NADH-quinone oxidoreductase subunit H